MKKRSFSIFTMLIVTVLSFVRCSQPAEVSNIHPLTKSWEIAVPNQEVPKGLFSLSAEDCGSCHTQHYQEWKMSTHAHAWTDLQFQAELKKESSPIMCINCHIPLQNQQEYFVDGYVDGDIYQPVKRLNPKFDRDLQQEGINCASCHVRDGAVIGTTGSTKAPHKTVKDPKFLSETLCISCHNAVAVVTPTLACSFETGDEWKAGPYYGQQNCISCHMDTIQREWMVGYGEKLSHRHYFPGSGIPKIDTVKTMMKNGFAFYPSLLEKKYSLSDSIFFKLKIKNEFAGHKVPTGDPERFFIIHFALTNKNGDIVSENEYRIGEHWQWHPAVKKIEDNNLLPNEERDFLFSYLPKKKGKYYLNVSVTKHRMDEKAAEYNNLGNEYPRFIPVFEKQYPILVEKE